MKKKILIVDDKINTLKVVGAILQDEGYEVFKAQSATQAMEIFKTQREIDAVLADLKMPGTDGLELYQMMSAVEQDIPFVIMTAHGTIESAVQAMKQGVTSYLIKPLNYEELGLVLERAIHERETSQELADLRHEVRQRYSFQNIIGPSQKMRDIFDIIRTVAPTDAPILIQGETGTGKELLARAIHSLSMRRDRSMVCINSAALTESLLEAELFGYVKGAFTGAVANKKGRFELADRGTLFLDEIGQMSLNLQSKLLRFLQDGTFDPVGSVENRSVDVRLITATNRNLHGEIKAGRFLNDLFYRIEVISINIPPLRERQEDLPLLVDCFIKRYSEQYKKGTKGIGIKAMDALLRYSWPGNVRELENCLARAVILGKEHQIGISDLPEKISGPAEYFPSRQQKDLIRNIPEQGIKLKTLEQELIQKTLEKCQGNKTLSAELLGISRKTLYEKIERYKVILHKIRVRLGS